jgi:hypothetical protein
MSRCPRLVDNTCFYVYLRVNHLKKVANPHAKLKNKCQQNNYLKKSINPKMILKIGVAIKKK